MRPEVSTAIQKTPAGARARHQNGSLEAEWHFSFGRYFDPARVHFGALRAYNRLVLKPGAELAPHAHRDMEILTIVMRGRLTHTDDRDTVLTLCPGDVLALSAGRGLHHAQANRGREPVELVQVWILPDRPHLVPRLAVARMPDDGPATSWWVAAAGPEAKEAPLVVHQRARLALARPPAGARLRWPARPSTRLYLHAWQGAGRVGPITLETGDTLEFVPAEPFELSTSESGWWVLVEVPEL
jgi:redox-sensitive bicupin YhaK (pirin superfamily)